MAKPQKAAATKAAKAEAKAARKAASKQRRSQLWQAFQMQRKGRQAAAAHDRRVRADRGLAVAGGLAIGGFTGYPLIPLGVVLGGLVAFIIFGRRAEVGVQQGRGADRRGGLGAGQHARQVAGDAGRGGHRPLRRGAPGDRPPG